MSVHIQNEIEYHESRYAQERRLADVARDPNVKDAHLKLAMSHRLMRYDLILHPVRTERHKLTGLLPSEWSIDYDSPDHEGTMNAQQEHKEYSGLKTDRLAG